MSAEAISARSLTVRYGAIAALTDVSFELPFGASVAVLGPNGSGKSTLLAAAVGLKKPASGSIDLGTARVAYAPQQLDLEASFPVTVADVVRMGRWGELGWLGRFGEHDHELVEGAIEALGLAGLRDRRLGEVSGGQRQRALLAQAAAQDARLLLLDEPFSGVDAPTRQAIIEQISGWRDEGRTIVVTTHDLESAARDYDIVVCLNGSLIACGPPEQACTEQTLVRTFAGHAVRVGESLVDVAHHHEGAG